MKKFRCTVCGYIHEGETAPEKCPVCKQGADKFVLVIKEEPHYLQYFYQESAIDLFPQGLKSNKALPETESLMTLSTHHSNTSKSSA